MNVTKLLLICLSLLELTETVSSFASNGRSSLVKKRGVTPTRHLRNGLQQASKDDVASVDTGSSSCWNPKLRRAMGSIATIGAIETSYLTFNKIAGTPIAFCTNEACGSFLNGPYSNVPGTSIPLPAVGFVAYTAVAFLAFSPMILSNHSLEEGDDDMNRIQLATVTTAMGAFAIFILTFLLGFVKVACPYCIFSAICMIVLAKLTWLGGVVPKESMKQAVPAALGGLATSVVASVLLLASTAGVADTTITAYPQAPPPITTTSSSRAMELASQLKELDTRFFGAYWCSHCYDQKETLGQEAMAMIPYIECSRDGLNQQVSLCKERNIPGYPTWDINGKLYPGEKGLDQLEEIVRNIKN